MPVGLMLVYGQTVQEPVQLLPADVNDLLPGLRPLEPVLFQALMPKAVMPMF